MADEWFYTACKCINAAEFDATYYIFAVVLKGKCYYCIRMGITIFKILIRGGISSDIR